MGIIGSILGRRESAGGFRTVDGGHPAPYPDMTDEQLYNYEVTFNVAHRTFERRPASATASEPAVKEATAKAATEKVLDSARFSARPGRFNKAQAASPPVPPASPIAAAGKSGLDLSKPVRLVTTRQPVEIITTRARHPLFKVHGYIGDATVATVFTLDGQLSENGPCFLENVPEQRQLYLNVYAVQAATGSDRYRITQHATRREADAVATPERLACVPVQFDERLVHSAVEAGY